MTQSDGSGVVSAADICKQYTPLVQAMVRRLHVPSSLQDDAQQEGFIGLLAAMRKYDGDSPVHFSVFARLYVKGAVLRHIYTRTQVTEAVTDNPAADDPTVGSAYETEAEILLRVRVGEWVVSLPATDAWIVRRLYWDDADTEQIAAELGITQRRVNQRHAKILRQGVLALGEHG